MPVTNYYTVDGSIIGEATAGVRTDYLTDALGSVTATVDSSGNLLNTYRYKPYGEQLAKTGAAADPKFTWVGTLGYRQTGRKHSDTYVRARHYSSTAGRWTTKDVLEIKNLDVYAYVSSNPLTLSDSTGHWPDKKKPSTEDTCWKWYDKFKHGKPMKLIPSKDDLSNCKHCSNPEIPSPATMTCLIFKETSFSTQGGDDLYGPGQIKPGTIKDWCKRRKECLGTVMGLEIPEKDLLNEEKCAAFIKRQSPSALIRLASAHLACVGWKRYGYVGTRYHEMFARCESCVNSAAAGQNWPYLNPKPKGDYTCFPTCTTCLKQVSANQVWINKHQTIPYEPLPPVNYDEWW